MDPRRDMMAENVAEAEALKLGIISTVPRRTSMVNLSSSITAREHDSSSHRHDTAAWTVADHQHYARVINQMRQQIISPSLCTDEEVVVVVIAVRIKVGG